MDFLFGKFHSENPARVLYLYTLSWSVVVERLDDVGCGRRWLWNGTDKPSRTDGQILAHGQRGRVSSASHSYTVGAGLASKITFLFTTPPQDEEGLSRTILDCATGARLLPLSFLLSSQDPGVYPARQHVK